MTQIDIGIIGGSGLYEMPGLRGRREITVETPFGPPSDAYVTGELHGRTVAFLARHGRGHRLLPSELNFRANERPYRRTRGAPGVVGQDRGVRQAFRRLRDEGGSGDTRRHPRAEGLAESTSRNIGRAVCPGAAADHQIWRQNEHISQPSRSARRRSVGRGFLETVNRTIPSVIGCYMAEPGWLDDIEIEVVEAALSLPGLDQTPP